MRYWYALAAIVLAVPAYAQTVTSTRIESASWTCRDASGAVLTSHERQDKAQEECTNRALASPGVDFEIRPSGFRIRAGAVTPPALAAPTLSGTRTASTSNPANSNITLTWPAVPGATSYEVERCPASGVACPTFTRLSTETALKFDNTGLPGTISYSYRARAIDGTRQGPYSNVWTSVPTPSPATGTASLTWTPPLENTDGSTLTDLAGYRIVYGTAPGSLTQRIEIPNADASAYVVESLAAGTWYFAISAYTSAGYESAQSSVVAKTIQ